MANHVNYYVQFHQMNDAAKARWQEMSQNLIKEEYNTSFHEYWFADLWADGKEGSPTNEDVRQYSWTTEHIGPKWCYIQDFEEDYFNGYSAWIAPEEGLVKLLEELKQLDPDIVTSIQYEDEMPNFVGWSVYKGSEMEDGCEWDEYEIREEIFWAYPNLKEHWDEENEEWKCDEDGNITEEADQAADEFRDIIYDVTNDMQSDGIAESVMHLTQEQK